MSETAIESGFADAPELPRKPSEVLRHRIEKDREDALAFAMDVASDAERSADATADLEQALNRVDVCSERLSRLADVKIVEPDLYERGGPHSFMGDIIASLGVPVHGNNAIEATERLRRHSEYEQSRSGDVGGRAAAQVRDLGIQVRSQVAVGGEATGEVVGAQQRALSTGAGAGGELVPPKWLMDVWAGVSRAACPLKGLVTRVGLMPGALELHVPRFDTAAGVLPDVQENITPPDQYSTTDQVISKPATFVGDALISQQLYDRGGSFADEILANDFAESYGQALAQQMMVGTGANGQLLGLLNVPTTTVNGVPGARVVTYTTGTPTVAGVIQATAQCAAQMSSTRGRSPSAILMSGRRWFALAGTTDGSGNEPTQRPGTGVVPADTDTGPYGPIVGLPVYHDATIPTNLGAGSNQDAIVLVRAKDILLLEDPVGPRFSAYLGAGTSSQLAVVMQWHMYTAVIPHRYPSGIGSVQSTGLVVPAGF